MLVSARMVHCLFLSCSYVARVYGDGTVLAVEHFPEHADDTGSSKHWADEPVVEALTEAMCAFWFFMCIWGLGKLFGWRYGLEHRCHSASKPTGRSTHRSLATSAVTSSQGKQFGLRTRKATSKFHHDYRHSPSTDQTIQNHCQAGANDPFVAVEADALASAARTGDAEQLPHLLDASMSRLMQEQRLAKPADVVLEVLLLASLRACASKRYFREALQVYSHIADRLGRVCPSVWSLLLWSAVEVGHYKSCGQFIERLSKDGVPTSQDFVNMVRYYVHRRDLDALTDKLKQFQARGWKIDAIARNRALSICATGRSLDLAQALVEHLAAVPMDAIAYNIMMKVFASTGDVLKAFEMYAEMQRANILPNEMTFGILLDACIDHNHMNHAREVFSDLRRSGLELNVILYTTFMKGLVNEGELTEAIGILEEMCTQRNAMPDLVTFSTLAKAFATAGNIAMCVELLERMMRLGIQPDGVLFNMVLTSCAAKPVDPEETQRLFIWLVKRGLKPSTATISVLIKAFSLSKSWRHALDVLEVAPDHYNVWPEPRVYGQLAQSCSQAGCRFEVLETYVAMVRAAGKQGAMVKKSNSTRLHRLCVLSGLGASSAKIFDALNQSEGRVDGSVAVILDGVA